MNKTVAGLGVFSVLMLVALAGCAQPDSTGNETNSTSHSNSIIPSIEPAAADADCQAISGVSDQDACYYLLAESERNRTWCNEIQSGLGETGLSKDQYIQKCINNVYLVEAIASNAVSNCGLIEPGLKNACIAEIALNKSDYITCNSMASDESFAKNTCIRSVAIKTESTSTCQKIPNTALAQDCIVEVAIKTADSTKCDLLPTPIQVEDCQAKVESA